MHALEELDLPLDARISPDAARHCPWPPVRDQCKIVNPVKALLRIAGKEAEIDGAPGQLEATAELQLEQTGQTRLGACFRDATGEELGAFYVYVERLGD